MTSDIPTTTRAPTAIPAAIAAALGDEGLAWLTAVLSLQDDALAAALERIAVLDAENQQLRAMAGKDSSNSSKPPSSDPPGAKAVRRRQAHRKPSGKKAGAQFGHVGKARALRPVEEADRIVPHFPAACGHCGADLAGARERSRPLPHQQYELPPLKLELVHHWLHRLLCPRCGAETTAELGAEDRTGQGPRLTAFIALLGVRYRQSRMLVRDLVKDLFDLSISAGTVQACWERTAAALVDPINAIEQTLQKAKVGYFDETGWKQWGKKCWLWVVTTTVCTWFMVHPRRNAEALDKLFPDGFEGTVHSDRWVVYTALFDATHRQLCWSHLGRDLQEIIDAKGAAATRTEEVRVGKAAMFHAWHAFKAGQMDRAALKGATASFRLNFRSFCKDGAAQEADALWRKLGASLIELWPAVFRFLDVDGVEPTNNHAERAIRPGVILRKLSGGTRSDVGSACVSRMLSVAATCRQQNIDVLDYLAETLTCFWRGIPPPRLIRARD